MPPGGLVGRTPLRWSHASLDPAAAAAPLPPRPRLVVDIWTPSNIRRSSTQPRGPALPAAPFVGRPRSRQPASPHHRPPGATSASRPQPAPVRHDLRCGTGPDRHRTAGLGAPPRFCPAADLLRTPVLNPGQGHGPALRSGVRQPRGLAVSLGRPLRLIDAVGLGAAVPAAGLRGLRALRRRRQRQLDHRAGRARLPARGRHRLPLRATGRGRHTCRRRNGRPHRGAHPQ